MRLVSRVLLAYLSLWELMPSSALATTPPPAVAWPQSHAPSQLPLLAVGRRPAKARKDVTNMYRDAMTYYNKGQYALAAQAFGRVLQRYPGHDPSRLQLAKTLYRLEKPREAYALFKQMDPQYLDPETSYEYAQCHFQQNELDKAIVAFKRVPKDHPLHDLAAYYAAIAAFRLKRYQEAEDLIEEAVVLPNKLLKSRNLYKKNISELRARQQEETLAREKAQAVQAMKAETKSLNDNLAKDRKEKERQNTATAETRSVPQEPPYRGFQELTTEVRVGGETKSIGASYPDEERNLQVNRAFFHFLTTPHRRFGKPSTLPGAVGMHLDLRLEDRYAEGYEDTAHPDDDEAATAYLYPDKSNSHRFGKARGALWLEVPLGPLLGGVEGAYYLASRDFKEQDSVSNASGQIFVGQVSKLWQWRVLGKYIQTQAAKKKLRQTTVGGAEGSWQAHEVIALYGSLLGKQYQYNDESLAGPDSRAEVLGGIKATLPWQITLGAELGYFMEKDYRLPKLAGDEDVIFDADSFYSRAYVEAKPLSWLGVKAYAARADRKLAAFSTEDEEAVAAANKTQYNLLSELAIMAYVNLLF